MHSSSLVADAIISGPSSPARENALATAWGPLARRSGD